MLGLRHEPGLAHQRDNRAIAATRTLDADKVLHETHPDDVVDAITEDRKPTEALLVGEIEHRRDRVVGTDGGHVGARHHDLAHDRVAEGEHRCDEFLFAFLDASAGSRRFRHRQEFVFGNDRRAGRAGEDDVADGSEQAGQCSERRDP